MLLRRHKGGSKDGEAEKRNSKGHEAQEESKAKGSSKAGASKGQKKK